MLNENILSALIIFSSGMFISYFGQSNIISLLGIYTGLIYIILICILSKYSIKKKNVEPFTKKEEKKKVNVFFFFAPWCPYSQKALPLWKKIKKSKKNDSSVTFELVNSEEDTKNLIDKYEIKSYPSFVAVNEDGKKQTFHEERTVEQLSEFIEKNQK